jgi:hypothetical protein
VSIKTDCILFDTKDNSNIDNDSLDDFNNYHNKIINDINSIFDINSNIGGYKLESGKRAINISFNNKFTNELLDIIDTSITNHPINNEYDRTEFKNIFENINTLVLGDCASAGKSTAVKNYDENCLFVTSFNKLSIENKKEGFESIIFNKLNGQGSNENKQYIGYDISNYKSICFDENYLYKIYYK